MKIRTDVDQILHSRAPIQQAQSQQNRTIQNQINTRPSIREIDQSAADRLTMERTLNDALNIAQISQTLLQKAMVVTSQLRNAAQQAIISGRTDTEAIRNAMADIQTTMKQYGENINAPQVSTTGNRDIPALPQIREDIQQVVSIAEQFSNGSMPDGAALNQIDRRLAARIGETGQAVSQIQNQIGPIAGPREISPEQMLPATMDLIRANPASALTVQGNVNRDAAVRILGA